MKSISGSFLPRMFTATRRNKNLVEHLKKVTNKNYKPSQPNVSSAQKE